MDVRNQAGMAPEGALTLGGRTFVCRPPKVADFAALRKEMRRQIQASMADPIAAVNRRISEAEKRNQPLSPTVAKLMVQEALAADSAGAKVEPTEAQIGEQAGTPDGIRCFAWILLRKADPGVTLEQVAEWVPTDDAAYALAERLAELSNLAGLNPNSEAPPTG
jgi:hypothetical protein